MGICESKKEKKKKTYFCHKGHPIEWQGAKFINKGEMICDKCGKYSNLYHPIRWKVPISVPGQNKRKRIQHRLGPVETGTLYGTGVSPSSYRPSDAGTAGLYVGRREGGQGVRSCRKAA